MTMAIAPEKQVVMKFFEAVGRRDVAAVRSILAEDVEFFVDVDPSLMPFGGRTEGVDAAVNMLLGSAGMVEGLAVNIKWMLSEGEKIVVLINEQATLPDTGRSYSVDSVHVYTVRDGKIMRFENRFNPLPMLQAARGDVRFEPPKPRGSA